MARSTFRCCQVSQTRLFSTNSLPTARKISATSIGGRFTSSVASSSVSLRQTEKDRVLPAGWQRLADDGVTDADKRWCPQAWCDRAEPESSEDQLLLRACGSQSCV